MAKKQKSSVKQISTKPKKQQRTVVSRWLRYGWWLVPLIAFLVYSPALFNEFTLDDIPIIEDNELIRSLDKLPEIWTSHYWSGKIDASDTGLYRPLTLTTYALQYVVHGDAPFPFHVLNILLHALTCFVLIKFLNLLFRDLHIAMLAGLLFAIHPIHTEAVAGIVGRAEIMAALFIMTAGISYHYYRETSQLKWLFGLIISTAAAITSKEHGFMLPLLIGLQEVFYSAYSPKKIKPIHSKWIGIASVFVLSLLLWFVRGSITGPSKPHEQWLGVDATDRMATSIRTTAEYIWMHLFPLKLSADYWSDQVPVVGFGNLLVIISLLFSLALGAVAFWQFKKHKTISWGILFFFITLVPVANFFFAAGFLKAERILYIPSIGLITSLAGLVVWLFDKPKWKTTAIVLIGVLSLFFSIRTLMRASEWKNNYTLAKATLKVSPNSPRFNNMMGLELRKQKRNKEALTFFEKAVSSNPNHIPALVNLGTEYRFFNRLDEAAATLEKALNTDPSNMMTYVNLMAVYRDMKDYDKNLAIAELALQRYPNSAPVLWNAGNAFHLKGDLSKANELRTKAKEIQPNIDQ